MRPGRLTPDNNVGKDEKIAQKLASMRPGRLTPDNLPRPHDAGVGFRPASMRPGRLTPDNVGTALDALQAAALQ